MVSIPINYSVRLAIVRRVGDTYIDFQFIDQIDNQIFRSPIPHPYAGRGGGIFVGIEKNSIILVANGVSEKWYCVAVIPDHNFYFDLDGASNIKYEETNYPSIKEGEIIIKGNKGQTLDLIDNGNIRIDAGLGTSSYDIELSKKSNALFRRLGQDYLFTEAGRSIEGIIKRDLRKTEEQSYTGTTNFLDGEEYDFILDSVGRFPYNETQNRTTRIIKRTLRNPALVEKRNITYEYADSFNVQSFQKELDAIKDVENSEQSEISALQSDPSYRKNRRTDILNLNLLNFNHLIEKVEGTVVDIYGNILDINRNKINIPLIDGVEFNKGKVSDLRKIYDYLRRSVKLHYEINSRKPINDSEPPETDKEKDNAKNFGKWSLDVDGEGLTKINIPASSETGNIPVLGRYINSRDSNDQESGSFKDDKSTDIRLQQFGAKNDSGNFLGQKINSDGYAKNIDDNSISTTGTAFHDLMSVAKSILDNRKLNSTLFNQKELAAPLSEKVTNKIYASDENITEKPNAGGRSIHANLDGSMEMSIGADTVDRKSIVLDTGGGCVSHIGRDINGRSVVQQLDGYVMIQIGGKGISGDSRFQSKFDTEEFPGRVEIHLNRPGGTPQKIIIDQNGLTFDIQKGIYFRSTGDIVFDSGSKILLNAEQILEYGDGDINSRSAGSSEITVRRKGRS